MRGSLKDLSQGLFDVLIIGGGINGAGIARDAALRGFRVALVEKQDYAAFTSSRSSKLIHGGIRYLEQFEFRLVRESLHERRTLMDIAPHLVKEQGFVLPVYKGEGRPGWQLRIGLKLYDLLAGNRNLRPHRWMQPEELLQEAPGLKPDGLVGGALYYDCRVDDARLVLENVLDAQRHGAKVLNHAEVIRLLRGPEGVAGARVRCNVTGQEADVRARVVINVAGPWVDDVVRQDEPGHRPMLRLTKGVHLVIPKVTGQHALTLSHSKDNRVFFVLPFNEHLSYVGTTDTDYTGDPANVAAEETDVQYLLSEVRRVFPTSNVRRTDVHSAWAGVRALLYTPGVSASKVSREYKIEQEMNGPLRLLINVCGGKITTYRTLADKVVRHLAQTLNKHLTTSTQTAALPLGGEVTTRWSDFSAACHDRFVKEGGLGQEAAAHLVQRYGFRSPDVLALLKEDPKLAEPLGGDTPYLALDVAAAVKLEHAVTLADV